MTVLGRSSDLSKTSPCQALFLDYESLQAAISILKTGMPTMPAEIGFISLNDQKERLRDLRD